MSNEGFAASLTLRKVYRVIEDLEAARHGMIRVVDDSDEDVLVFVTAATERGVVNQLGQWGIGTTSPDALLDLETTGNDHLRLTRSASFSSETRMIGSTGPKVSSRITAMS